MRLAILSGVFGGDEIAAAVDHDGGAVFDAALRPPARSGIGSGKPSNESATATATGAMVPSVA